MRCKILVALISLSAMTACSPVPSTAEEYTKKLGADNAVPAEKKSETETPKGTENDPLPADPAVVALLEKGVKILNDTCMTCHGSSMISKQVLDKNAISKLDAAAKNPIHSGIKENYEGDERKALEAALSGL